MRTEISCNENIPGRVYVTSLPIAQPNAVFVLCWLLRPQFIKLITHFYILSQNILLFNMASK
jgi:hypothetical protein